MQQVALSSNVGSRDDRRANCNWGVLHIDDVPIIERESKKKVITVVDINKVQKVNHYMTVSTTQEAPRRTSRYLRPRARGA